MGLVRTQHFMTQRDVARVLGVQPRIVKRWLNNGKLLAERSKVVGAGRHNVWAIEAQALERFLVEHPEEYNITRIDPLLYPDWLAAARRADHSQPIARQRLWSKEEDHFLLSHVGRMSYVEIGARLRRTRPAVEQHVRHLRLRGVATGRALKASKRWSEAEAEALRKGRGGTLRRSTSAIKSKILHLRRAGEPCVPPPQRAPYLRWTEAEDRRVREAFGTMPDRVLAGELGRTMAALRYRARRLGVSRLRPRAQGPGALTGQQAAARLGVSAGTTYRWLRSGILPAVRSDGDNERGRPAAWRVDVEAVEALPRRRPDLFNPARVGPGRLRGWRPSAPHWTEEEKAHLLRRLPEATYAEIAAEIGRTAEAVRYRAQVLRKGPEPSAQSYAG
jgi:excisionase family DNA binding protein